MRFVAVALLLLCYQYFASSAPTPSESPTAIESLLEERNSTETPVVLVGRVVDAAPTWGNGVRLTMAMETADEHEATGLVSVSLRETSRRWRTGDRLSLRSRLRRVLGFGNFGELDWAAYNARRGLFVTAYAWREDDVTVLPANDGLVDRLRRRFAEACEAVGGQGAEILEALVIGDRTGIDQVTSVAVRDAGLAHFLAISGSHMALIVVLVVWLVRRAAGLSPTLLERYDVLRPAAVLAALAVVAYGAVSGGGVSVARSVLMALAAMVALWRGRPGDAMRALGGSAVILALLMPGVGGEAGFQLSYIAVVALVLDARRRREARGSQPRSNVGASATRRFGSASLSRDGSGEEVGGGVAESALPPLHPRLARLATLLWSGLAVLLEAARLTVVCWIVTSPIVAHHFQRISLVAPLANLLAAPLVSAIVVSGIGGLALLPVSPLLGGWAVSFGAFLSGLVVQLSVWCASLPLAATTTPSPSVALTFALSGLALVLLFPPGASRRLAAPLLVGAATVFALSGLHDRYRGDRLDVWFASVGQGDAAIVRMPGGKVWVVDQGPPGRGRMVVGPLLRRAWIGRVDVLVASHLQSDHSGAMAEILEEFDVGEVWLPDGPCDTAAAHKLLGAAAERGVPVRFVSREGLRTASGSSHANQKGATGADTKVAGTGMEGATTDAANLVNAQTVFVANKQAATSNALGARLLRPKSDAAAATVLWPEANAAAVHVLWPEPGAAACNDNDQSLVLAFEFAGRRLLFTGDIEARAESELASRDSALGSAGPLQRESNALRADVLKVPHHGSRTSSTETFLQRVQPHLAVASLGLDNPFHFPAPEVVERYRRHGVNLLRTDQTGAVHLVVDEDGGLSTEQFLSPESLTLNVTRYTRTP